MPIVILVHAPQILSISFSPTSPLAMTAIEFTSDQGHKATDFVVPIPRSDAANTVNQQPSSYSDPGPITSEAIITELRRSLNELRQMLNIFGPKLPHMQFQRPHIRTLLISDPTKLRLSCLGDADCFSNKQNCLSSLPAASTFYSPLPSCDQSLLILLCTTGVLSLCIMLLSYSLPLTEDKAAVLYIKPRDGE